MKGKKSVRPVPGISREEEEKQLALIIEAAQENLEKTEKRIGALSEELHDLMETYGPKDKEALALLHNTQSQLRENKRDLLRCQKARRKPYFGRIDFRDAGLLQEESYYVGRVGISKGGAQPLVVDWRAPVASVYYENALGPCRYVVKNEGTYEIELTRKRTYEIEDDRLKDFFDSDIVANDELLTKFLAKSKRAVLGEIIATIQKEQNAIIRKSPKTNVIVQGVAGSGKTTVAMHRISYILYNYEEEFRPEDFYIIGSNRILLNYITGVLPELDVYGVSQMTMEQLFVRLLYEDWNPKLYGICPIDKKDRYSHIKGSYEWFHALEKFCGEYEKKAIPHEEVRLEKKNVLLIDTAAIERYLKENPQISVQGKINMLNEILQSKLENELTGKYVSYTQEEKKEIRRQYRRYFGGDVWKGSVFELYRDFLQQQKQNGADIFLPGKSFGDTKNVQINRSAEEEKRYFDVYDLAALAYLYKRIKETDGIREASHVIIDEAQDFGMMVYGALAYCLRGCTYTIMGDVSQNIHFGYGLNDWNDLQELMLRGTFDTFALLKKSYRNTVEISNFATEILRHGDFPIYPTEPIKRHGADVQLMACKDEDAMLLEAVKIIEKWQAEGHETIAVICRDEKESAAVSSRLGRHLSLCDNNLETAEFGNGIMVLPVEYTKGLEFDAVLLYHPSKTNYPAGDAYVKLLYVAATRALHELAVVHQNDLTELIAKEVSEEKRMRSLENEIRRQPRRFEETEITVREQEILDVKQGDKERAMRGYIGPKAIIARTPVTLKKDVQGSRQEARQGRTGNMSQNDSALTGRETLRNHSPYHFLDVPDNSLLRPRGHSRIDCSIRMVKKTKCYIDLISSYGILRLTPLGDDVMRVQFRKDRMEQFSLGTWDYRTQSEVGWTAKEGRNLLEISTGKIKARIEKKTGALQFFGKNGTLLLKEKEELPRQMECVGAAQNWLYFDWAKNEKLFAKGVLADDLQRISQKARYISHGGRALRMPLVISENGYGIAVNAKDTVMCCAIPMYGPYLYTENEEQIDYYFLYGESRKDIIESYLTIQGEKFLCKSSFEK